VNPTEDHMENEYQTRDDCRLCLSKDLVEVLRLNPTPPANEFVSAGTGGDIPSQSEIPLYLVSCRQCGHVQLPVVVDPERLFRNYVYVSGTSSVFVDHFRRYADDMIRRLELVPGDLVVEVGSNDGTLLKFFQEAGMRVVGVDPAKDIAARATADGVQTWNEFFTLDTAHRVVKTYGFASLVIANNVFAHADDLCGIAHGVRSMLDPRGVFMFENSYLPDVLEKTLFDTVYHEHLSYHSVGPLVRFFQSVGMSLRDVQRVDTHGGSIRGCAVPHKGDTLVTKEVTDLLSYESALGLEPGNRAPFLDLEVRMKALRQKLREFLAQAKAEGKRVAGFGAPAKATTLMYQFGLDSSDLEFIVDDSPLKQGLFTPGKHVPVLPSSAIRELKPDYLVVLAWNFADHIIAKNQAFRDAGGKFVVPIPDFRVV
jgi:SAM-dependent methyltransferase